MAIGGSLASTSIRTAISEPAFWPGAAHGAALGPTAQSTSDGGATITVRQLLESVMIASTQ